MNANQSSDGRFPYGEFHPDYREFLIPNELILEFEKHQEANQQSSDPLIIAKYFNPM